MADNSSLFHFMFTECDFSIEHADGSFLDHLHFCHDYTAVHFSSASPRVMLLHSIMGVGTNCFPMGIEKLPTLRVSCALPTTHDPLPTTHCPLCIAHCSLPTTHCPLPTAYYPLPTAHCPLVVGSGQ